MRSCASTRSSRAACRADAEDAFDGAAFDDGVERALRGCSLLQTAFSVRTRSLFGSCRAASLASYLSGLVIGEELRCRPLEGVVLGRRRRRACLDRAIRACPVAARHRGAHFDEDAAWRGLWALDRLRRRREGAQSDDRDPGPAVRDGMCRAAAGRDPARDPARRIGRGRHDPRRRRLAIIEVPLNSPEPLLSIAALAAAFPTRSSAPARC